MDEIMENQEMEQELVTEDEATMEDMNYDCESESSGISSGMALAIGTLIGGALTVGCKKIYDKVKERKSGEEKPKKPRVWSLRKKAAKDKATEVEVSEVETPNEEAASETKTDSKKNQKNQKK